MSHTLMVLVPFLVLPVVMLLAFTGCSTFSEAPSEPVAGPDVEQPPPSPPPSTPPEPGKPPVPPVVKAYREQVLEDPALLSYWRLGETAGPIARDSAPDAPRDGGYLGGVTLGQTGALAPKDGDRAPAFDGANDYVEVPYHVFLNPPMSFSVELWLRPTGTSSGADQVVFSSRSLSGNAVRGFDLRVVRRPDPNAVCVARIGSGAPDPDVSKRFREASASLGAGSTLSGWRYVVLAYSAPAKSATLYVNGVAGTPATGVAFIPNQDKNLRIGAGRNEVATAGELFQGNLDEVALYNVPLSQATIAARFAAATS